MIVLNDKNGTIFNLNILMSLSLSFLILVSGKGVEILYYFKPFLQGTIKRQVDYFLFHLGSLILKVEFGYVFLVMIVKLT